MNTLYGLSSLDNIIQLGIALLLAYLNLDKFKFIKQAIKNIQQDLQSLKPELIKLSDAIIDNYDNYKKIEKLLKTLQKIEISPSWKKIKELNFNKTYNCLIWVFAKKIDKGIAILLSILLSLLLVVNTQYYPEAYLLFSEYPSFVFYFVILSSISSALAMVMVWIVNAKIDKTIIELSENLRQTIRDIKQTNTDNLDNDSSIQITSNK